MQIFYKAVNNLGKIDGVIAVALSGGADSTALLYAAKKIFAQQVVAIHIRHGLQAKDPEFAAHCQQVCQQLQIPLYLQQVNAQAASGQSPEDAARNARYQGLISLAKQHSISSILLAHHGDDQVETILLALSRGAGMPGISAMPNSFLRNGIKFYRPLLALTTKQIRQRLTANNISWIEDPSNQDIKYTRNKIRLKLLPVIQQHFPQYVSCFARSARLIAQGQLLAEQLAMLDLQAMQNNIVIKQLQLLTAERQANVIRFWLKTQHQTTGSEAQIVELLKQIKACTTNGHKINLKIGSGQLCRNKTILQFNK